MPRKVLVHDCSVGATTNPTPCCLVLVPPLSLPRFPLPRPPATMWWPWMHTPACSCRAPCWLMSWRRL